MATHSTKQEFRMLKQTGKVAATTIAHSVKHALSQFRKLEVFHSSTSDAFLISRIQIRRGNTWESVTNSEHSIKLI
jgi:hypothetical protein